MTEQELVQVQSRVDAASPGPWRIGDAGDIVDASGRDVHYDWVGCHPSEADTAFVLAARQDVPALIAEVRRLQEALDVYHRFYGPGLVEEQLSRGGAMSRPPLG